MPVRELVGRASELAELARALDTARAGRGSVVLVGGPAGIGKSRLVDELADLAGAAGVPVLRGRAMAEEGTPALWPWWQALRPYPDLADALDVHTGPAATLTPEVPRGERLRAFELLLAALAERAAGSGLAVVLEDLHWADESSLRMLGLSAGRAGLLVVATYRDDEQTDALRATLTQLRRDGSTAAITLHPWDAAELASVVDGAAHPSWLPLLARASGGNPLYVQEMLGALTDAGLADRPAPESAEWPLGVPEQLRGIVAERLARLPEPVREVVRACAVIGADWSVPAVALLCETTPEAVLDHVDAAAGLLVPGHELVREAVYATVPTGRAVAWHRRLAEAIEAGELPGEAVTHRLRSITDDAGRDAAVEACRTGAALAMGRLAFDRAAGLLDAALDVLAGQEHPDRLVRRCELLLDAADADYSAGLVEAATRRCQAAAELASRADRSDLLARAALVVRGVGGPVSAPIMVLCDRALAALPESARAWRARVLAQRALAVADALRPADADEPSREALALAEQTGDPLAMADALRARQQVLSHPDGVTERLEVVRRMLELGAAGPPDGELWARLWRIDAALQLGALSTVDEELARIGLLADRLGWPIAHWHLHKLRTARALLLGHFAEAQRETEEMLRAAVRTEDASAQALVLALRFELCELRGGHAELVDAAQMFAELSTELLVAQSYVGLFLLHAGDTDGAWRCHGRIRPALAEQHRDARWLPTLANAGVLAAGLGDLDVVRHCYDELLPCAGYYLASGSGTLLCSGSVSRLLGTMAVALDRPADAERHLTEAIAMDDRIGALPYRTLAEIELAGVLADADPARAGTLTRNAATSARRLGMAPALRTADEVLRRVDRARREAVPLTARERDVLARLARGASNREIAEELVLSERTVETHVRNVLAKVGVANRAQAAVWAVEQGIAAQ
ncbi:MAG: ATP-binding protein [Actinophytocola sp.]|uniref:ATP-binding protein n=1 Tax=Actinophytocola sp. TaxID=1872138 RepID=UPI003D6AB6F9